MQGKQIVILGKGRLVGMPLLQIFEAMDYNVLAFDEHDGDVSDHLREADVIISATGKPGLLSSDNIKQGAVVIDAGVAVEAGETKGDLAEEVYKRTDLTITPKRGGVGPLTVCALFENVLRAASR